MSKLILNLYDYFTRHRGTMAFVLVILTLLLCLLVTRINYKENIIDFLPLDGNQQSAMRMYQDISGANRIIALIGMDDNSRKVESEGNAEYISEATDAFSQAISKEKLNITSSVDLDKVSALTTFVYNNIPYFLTSADYKRIDSLLQKPDYVKSQLQRDMETLMFPSGGMLTENIGRDPLNLFTPTVEKLNTNNVSAKYELYNGHIFTPDMKNAILMIESPYGSSETEKNGELVSHLSNVANKVKSQYKNIDVKITGGPVIAVGNASQIKSDSILTIALAVVFILILLIVSFRSTRNILLIAVTIAWGWFFALGCLSIVHNTVSLIVIGISSVIIGIAVNYPLHLVAHLNHTPDMRKALKEIVSPLLVGNITTIGAFLALVPLKSIALRDLGLFAAFLLIGTIFFVFMFLPHFVKVSAKPRREVFSRVAGLRLENKTWIVALVAVLTLVFAIFSFRTSFDSDISHINYMSKDQQKNVNYLSKMLSIDRHEKTIYAVAMGKTQDEALLNNEKTADLLSTLTSVEGVRSVQTSSRFLVSRKEQQHRLQLWKNFIRKYSATVCSALAENGSSLGFNSDSFNDFYSILSKKYQPREPGYFKPLTDGPLHSYVFYDNKGRTYNVITPITVDISKEHLVTNKINAELSACPSSYSFEIGKLNSSLAESLSDNFNYIGFACSLIVFFFLWLSFGNIELAALSFLPMAVSWLWILGIMSVLGIQFNIINIILATFIFGQGDDYTIFITEGCQYEYTYRRKVLTSYKSSIIISALIMFIGMGVLVVAKHPALRSLGEVTVVGMLSVVIMAYIIPPFMFKWITAKNGKLRNRPLTLKSLLMPRHYPQIPAKGKHIDDYVKYVRDVYYYCDTAIVRNVHRALANHNKYVVSENNNEIVVGGGSYGAVALLMALANPQKTITVRCNDEDDTTVCKNMACRIVKNIRFENE